MIVDRRGFLMRASLPLMAAGFSARLLGGEGGSSGFPGLIVRQSEPENLEFPFTALRDAIVPNEQFFVRSHFPVPQLDVKDWKLTVEGAVKQKLEITYDDLMKFPAKTLSATIECAGNNRVSLTPAVSGLQWGSGAVGNAAWRGVPLAAVLEKAGLRDSAVEVILEGADKGQINNDPKSPGPIRFSRSIPMQKAMHESVLLAYQMNGADLPVAHGFPVRAVVGGWYGMSCVKWLSRIIVADAPYGGFFQTLDYSYFERKNDLPTLLPVTKMQVKSAIAQPALGSIIAAGKQQRVFGAAWAGESSIAKVEISVDGGKTWENAKLLDKAEALVWTRWEYAWNVPNQRGPARLMARATDAEGRTQPLQRDVDRRSYMITHVLPIDVTIR